MTAFIPPQEKITARNRLLDALPPHSFQRLAKHVGVVSLSYGQVLYEPGSQIESVYFPYDCVISLLRVVSVGKAAEVAVVGREGVVGGSTAIGLDISSFRAVVQVAGSAACIPAARMLREFKVYRSWNPELLHFNHALMNQVAQTAACNRFHNAEARLARWLLTTADRAYSQHIFVTHEFLSGLLGLRRVGVSTAAAQLQEQGLITYSRGNIELLDVAGLKQVACECYGVIKEMYDFS